MAVVQDDLWLKGVGQKASVPVGLDTHQNILHYLSGSTALQGCETYQ